MNNWAAEELQYADLGDIRRNKRLIRLVSDLAAQPNASVTQASGDWAATQAAYDFWSSPHVKPEAIRLGHQKSTIERIKQQSLVIAIQDTTEANFTHHSSKKGMGYLDNASSRGLKIHSVLCSSANGVPLGILHQQVWARDPAELGKKHQRHKKPIQDKESQRWLTALDATQSLIPEETVVVTVADREADIYQLFVLPRRPNSEFLIRANHNRCVKANTEDQPLVRLQQAIRQIPAWGQLSLELRRHPEREPRVATLTLRATTLELQPPAYVLKSGCRLEQLQLAAADRIHRALATYTIVAWRLLWITYLARYHPDTPADTVLQTHEWQALYCTIHQTPTPPDVPPNLNACVRWIAQLGGVLARKQDGEPGVKTIWQGLRRLHDITQTWLLLSPTTTTSVKPDFIKKDVSNA